MKGFKKIMVIGMVALAALIGIQATSQALTLYFDDLAGNTISLADDDFLSPIADLNHVTGAVTFSGTVGNWFVNVTTGLSKPVIGSATSPEVDLNSLNVSSPLGGSMRIVVVDSGFTGPIQSGVAGPFDFMVGGTTQGTVSLTAFYDSGNTETGAGTNFAFLPSFSNSAFSGATQGSFNATGPFALGIIADIVHAGNQTRVTSFDADLKAVPEPTTLLLLGLGLVGMAAGLRKGK